MHRRDFLRHSFIAFNGALLVTCDGGGAEARTELGELPAPDGTLPAETTAEAARQADSFLVEGWKFAAPAGPLPAWHEGNRVQPGTRLDLRRWLGKPEFTEASAASAELGAKVLTRHFKSGPEPSWADSRPETVRAMIEAAHARGQRIVAYYWHMADAEAEKEHPDWLCRTVDGRPSPASRGNFLDLSSAWRDRVRENLLQLAEMGVDGFFFDSTHLPRTGCFGTALQREYEARTGRTAPTAASDRDPAFQHYLEFHALQIEEAFDDWRRTVKARFPQCVFVVSATFLPALVDRRHTTNLVRIADCTKHEFRLALKVSISQGAFRRTSLLEPADTIRMAFGWALLRDSADGRPPRIVFPGMGDRPNVEAFVAAVVTWGAIANINFSEPDLIRPTTARGTILRDAYRRAFELGDLVSPALSGTRPVRWAAVHFSEIARNARGTDAQRMWREVLWPAMGAFGAAIREGVPVGVVNDYQLARGELDGYRVLFLADAVALTPPQAAAVERFAAGGGTVIRHDANNVWHTQAGFDAAETRVREQLRRLAMSSAPVQVSGAGPFQAAAYRHTGSGRTVVAITNDFGWVSAPQYGARSDVEEVEEVPARGLTPRPAAIRDLVVRVPSAAGVKSARELITGRDLDVATSGSDVKIAVPEFGTWAVVQLNTGA